jgi:hypothetical protein
MMNLQDKITAAKAEFDGLYAKTFPTSADFDRMAALGSKLYRLRIAARKFTA